MNTLTTEQDFSEVLQQIQQARQKVFTQVNTALIDLYWHIGKTISHKVQTQAWGKGVVSELERQIDTAQFERTLIGNQKLSALLRELHPTIGNTFKDNYVLEFLGLPPVMSVPPVGTSPEDLLPCKMTKIAEPYANHPTICTRPTTALA